MDGGARASRPCSAQWGRCSSGRRPAPEADPGHGEAATPSLSPARSLASRASLSSPLVLCVSALIAARWRKLRRSVITVSYRKGKTCLVPWPRAGISPVATSRSSSDQRCPRVRTRLTHAPRGAGGRTGGPHARRDGRDRSAHLPPPKEPACVEPVPGAASAPRPSWNSLGSSHMGCEGKTGGGGRNPQGRPPWRRKGPWALQVHSRLRQALALALPSRPPCLSVWRDASGPLCPTGLAGSGGGEGGWQTVAGASSQVSRPGVFKGMFGLCCQGNLSEVAPSWGGVGTHGRGGVGGDISSWFT